MKIFLFSLLVLGITTSVAQSAHADIKLSYINNLARANVISLAQKAKLTQAATNKINARYKRCVAACSSAGAPGSLDRALCIDGCDYLRDVATGKIDPRTTD